MPNVTYLLRHLLLTVTGQLEFHLPQLSLNLARRLANFTPAVTLRDRLLRLVVEAHHTLHHPVSFPHGAELVVVRVSVLLQEVLLDQCGDVQSDLVRVAKRRLTDQLHDLVQIFRSRKQLLDTAGKPGVFRVVFLVVLLERGGVFTVRLTGVDGREMLALSQFLVQTPEDLHDTQG